MISITILSILVVLLIFLGIIEYWGHKRNLSMIPIRIHVNGTRGKSSVTRLIAAGLREHGIKTCAKTTGTLPRMILTDGREFPIYRPSAPNIIEQLRIVSIAAQQKAQALVVECMALQPVLQSLSELTMIRATHGVITNVRPDHLDIMGPSENDVALALLSATPRKAHLFTSEHDYIDWFSEACADRETKLSIIDQEAVNALSDTDMARFSYVEHKDNVALALKVCESLGVPREAALAGMWKATPDIGVLKEFHVSFFGRTLLFVNGFAANDPTSTERIWHMTLEKHHQFERRILIINTRADRPDRSQQIAKALPDWPKAYRYILIGSGTYAFIRAAIVNGMDASVFVDAENMETERLFERILGLTEKSALIMGIGNIAGPGLELLLYFQNRAHF